VDVTSNTPVTADRTWLVVVAVSSLGWQDNVRTKPMMPGPAL
jgi:hypothetical protein